MSFDLSLKHILASVAILPQLAFSSPLAPARVPRGNVTITVPLSSITPTVIQHGTLDGGQLADLIGTAPPTAAPKPTKDSRAVYINTPDKVRRQDGATSTTAVIWSTSTSGPYVSVDMGNKATMGDNCPEVIVNGPIRELQVFEGSSSMRAFNATDSAGNHTSITTVLDGSTDAGTISIDANERITEMYIFLDNINYLGFNFTTSNGKTYEALGTTVKPTQAIKVPVGSGIIARIRVSKCEIGLFGSWGFDFIGDLASIAVTNIAYSGFTDSVLPAGSGDTVTVGSQVVDNRNSSTDQTIQLQTTDAVTQSHSLSVADMWQTGGSISIETEAGLPLIAKSKINTQLNWAVQQTTTKQDMNSETVTKSATVSLKCPAGKYCVGSSFFTAFKMDVDVNATFTATTKSGDKFSWYQGGTYKGADSLALQLKVDEADTVIQKRMPLPVRVKRVRI